MVLFWGTVTFITSFPNSVSVREQTGSELHEALGELGLAPDLQLARWLRQDPQSFCSVSSSAKERLAWLLCFIMVLPRGPNETGHENGLTVKHYPKSYNRFKYIYLNICIV